MNLEYFFGDDISKPLVEVSQPANHSFLVRNAFTFDEIQRYFFELSKLPWIVQEVVVAGKTYLPKRETLAFADPKFSHLLENRSSKGFIFSNTLIEIRDKVQKILIDNINELYSPPVMNYCWGNRYRDGSDKVGKHKDNEKWHSTIDPIVSVSFGTHRHFDIYKENKLIERIDLGHGDIFLMMPGEHGKSGFQKEYYHAVPQQKRIQDPRINLTYRTIIRN